MKQILQCLRKENKRQWKEENKFDLNKTTKTHESYSEGFVHSSSLQASIF